VTGARAAAPHPRVWFALPWLLVPILLLGAWLRIRDLDTRSLWRDEGETLIFVQADYARMSGLARTVPHIPVPPLHFAATRLLLGPPFHLPHLRWPPVLFGILLIPAVWLLGRELLPPGGANLAALLTAGSPLLVRYSQEARPYALLILLVTLALWCEVRALAGGGRAWWAGVALALTGALYTHHFALLALAGSFLLAFLARPTGAGFREVLRRSWWAWSAIGLAYLPLAGHLWRGLTGPRGFDAAGTGSSLSRADLVAVLSLAGPPPFPMAWLILLPALLFLLAGRPPRAGGRLLPWLLVALPWLVAVVLPFRHDLKIRYLLFTLPLWYLLASGGILLVVSRFRSRTAPLLLLWLVAVAVPTARALAAYTGEGRQDWRGAARLLARESLPGDLILVDGRGDPALNTRRALLLHYAPLGQRVRVAVPGRSLEDLLAREHPLRLWHVGSADDRGGDPAPQGDTVGHLRERGWRALPPVVHQTPTVLGEREIWWLGPPQFRSLVVTPLLPPEAGEGTPRTGDAAPPGGRGQTP
jgi:hypothetical protein